MSRKKMVKLKCYSLLNNFGSSLSSIEFLSRIANRMQKSSFELSCKEATKMKWTKEFKCTKGRSQVKFGSDS